MVLKICSSCLILYLRKYTPEDNVSVTTNKEEVPGTMS